MDRFGAYARILFGGVVLQPDRRLGSTTHTFTIHGISITATAFNGGNLFAKNSDPDETGMGLADNPSGDHEIFAKMGGLKTISSLICWA
jgi:hypothetical protein